jgi:hypothetical protein
MQALVYLAPNVSLLTCIGITRPHYTAHQRAMQMYPNFPVFSGRLGYSGARGRRRPGGHGKLPEDGENLRREQVHNVHYVPNGFLFFRFSRRSMSSILTAKTPSNLSKTPFFDHHIVDEQLLVFHRP